MKRSLVFATAAMGAVLASYIPARASVILFTNPNPVAGCAGGANCSSIVDFGGLGFGAYPRVLTLHDRPTQVGGVGVDANGNVVTTGDAIATGNNKSSSPTFGELGYTSGSQLAIGYNSSQTGNTGISLNDLRVDIYNVSNTLVQSFSLDSPIQFSAADLALQQGNGQGLFIFKLDAAQATILNNILIAAGNTASLFHIGMFADMGCVGTVSATCQPSNGGIDSFLLGFRDNLVINPVDVNPVPLPAAVWMFLGGIGTVSLMLRRNKRRREAAMA